MNWKKPLCLAGMLFTLVGAGCKKEEAPVPNIRSPELEQIFDDEKELLERKVAIKPEIPKSKPVKERPIIQEKPVYMIPSLNGNYSSNVEVSNFKFCTSVENYNCVGERESIPFKDGKIWFTFNTTIKNPQGLIELVTDYRLYGPNGKPFLTFDDNPAVLSSGNGELNLLVKDYFNMGLANPTGTYTLDLKVKNKITGEERMIRRTFTRYHQ